ncbi:MAG: hypothetical protein AB7I30_16710 [Isosphaeraceae bacterium]
MRETSDEPVRIQDQGPRLATFPGVVDLVFFLMLISVMVGGRYRLLNDPGSFWHARLGRDVLTTGGVPRADSLTFTRGGAPWVDQSWLFDVILARVVDVAGWSGAVLCSGLLLAGLYSTIARGLLRDGRRPIVAMVVAVLAAGVGSIHFLVRPHLLTLVLFWIFLRVCRRQHERGGWVVGWLPVFSVFWANVHGGFLAGPVVVFTAAAGHAIAGPWSRERLREVLKFGAAGVLCIVAALVNPYGFGLYRHVAGLLVSANVTDLIQEYQPIPFGKADARVVEWVILALIAVPTFARSRISRYELSHALIWMHFALSSVRNAPLFALAAAPGLAMLLDGLLSPREEDASRVGIEATAAWSFWSPLAVLGLGIGLLLGVPYGAFEPSRWPVAALAEVNRLPLDARLFHEQDWGGMIESETRPLRLAFIDDRFELYGREGILRYLNALEGGPDWDEIQEREGVGAVWVRPERPLARRLSRDPQWKERHRDAVSVLFEKVEAPLSPGTIAGRLPRNSD